MSVPIVFGHTLNFEGPYSFVLDGARAWQLEQYTRPGIYLFVVSVRGAYKFLYVGEAMNVALRLRGHMRDYLAGKYQLYDGSKLREGIRVQRWSLGLPPEQVFEQIDQLHSLLRETLPLLQILVAPVEGSKTDLQLIESVLVHCLRSDSASRQFLENHKVSRSLRDIDAHITVNWPASVHGFPVSFRSRP